MTTGTRETEIVVDPKVPLVAIIREFDAPPEKVFRAHTDPELLARWLGPRDTEMRIDQFDCRTGGSYRHVHTRDGMEFGFHGCFHDVRRLRAHRADLHLRGRARAPRRAAGGGLSASPLDAVGG